MSITPNKEYEGPKKRVNPTLGLSLDPQNVALIRRALESNGLRRGLDLVVPYQDGLTETFAGIRRIVPFNEVAGRYFLLLNDPDHPIVRAGERAYWLNVRFDTENIRRARNRPDRMFPDDDDD